MKHFFSYTIIGEIDDTIHDPFGEGEPIILDDFHSLAETIERSIDFDLEHGVEIRDVTLHIVRKESDV